MKRVQVDVRSEKTEKTDFKERIRIAQWMSVTLLVLSICTAAGGALAQQGDQDRDNMPSLDPGPRVGFAASASGNPNFPHNPGDPIQGLTSNQTTFFTDGLSQFNEVEGVTLTGPGNGGLGPTFNSNSCGSCHSQPATGGTSPSMSAFPNVGQNPQFTVGQLMKGNLPTNTTPFFVLADGPVREARFKSDGGVHDLFTIGGRTDAPGCTQDILPQPDFAAAASNDNLIFRIPTPVFGAGLIENIGEATILANLAASASRELGIAGAPNRSGNDGSITRFGWKAQNKSLLIFAGEAYNVEMGITNEFFPNERGYPPYPIPAACLFNATPEDPTNFEAGQTDQVPSDVASFANFMRFLAQPIPACGGTPGIACSPQIQRGTALFTTIGCANCHTPFLITDKSETATGLSQVKANLFSDLALHHMGTNLADGITQGNAGPDQFRTAPLWGVGQRVFFLHDGRTGNLVQAIREHAGPGSEANRVIRNFHRLSTQDKQNLILFLRSL
jgi:CxxC motif-containing protein (DUF1111 family)